MSPQVSYIMCTRNPRREWIVQSAGAVLAEQGCTVELIVVDDGSDELVSDVLDLRDERLRVIRVEHGGPGRARNYALEVAKGQFIRYIDDDDMIVSGSTVHLMKHARLPDVIGFGATVWCDAELRPVSVEGSSAQGNVMELCLTGSFPVMIPAMLIPREAHDRAGSWDPQLLVMQDWDLVLRLLEHATVRGDMEQTFFYRRHPTSNSSLRRPDLVLRCWRRILDKTFSRHPELAGTAVQRKAEADYEVRRGTIRSCLRATRLNWRVGLRGALELAASRLGRRSSQS